MADTLWQNCFAALESPPQLGSSLAPHVLSGLLELNVVGLGG